MGGGSGSWITYKQLCKTYFLEGEANGALNWLANSDTWSVLGRYQVQVAASLGSPADWVMGWAKWLSLVCTFNSCQRPILDKPSVFFLMNFQCALWREAAAVPLLPNFYFKQSKINQCHARGKEGTEHKNLPTISGNVASSFHRPHVAAFWPRIFLRRAHFV